MTLPTLTVGVANPEIDAAIAAAVLETSVEAVAKDRDMSRTAVRNALGRHRSRREFDLFLDQTIAPLAHVRVCHVVTIKPFTDVALAAYRAFPGTLKKLETPGWVLTYGKATCSITDLQQATGRARSTDGAKDPRRATRERLGMRV